jgi:hypothetical protein
LSLKRRIIIKFKMLELRSTSRGACGATMDPILPKVEHAPIMEWRNGVGNSSLVMTYVTVKDTVDPNFPIKYMARLPVGESAIDKN